MNQVSTRLVRSSLRYLRERVGAAAVDAAAEAALGPSGADFLARYVQPERHPWCPMDQWVKLLGEIEQRHGDPPTWRLLREMTRATLAAAISSVWANFLSDLTVDALVERAPTFWSLSYDTGTLEASQRSSHHVSLILSSWPSPPATVGPSLAEACAVFLARVGVAAPRAVVSETGGQITVTLSW